MKRIHQLALGTAVTLVLALGACSSEEAAAPSRPPIPPPIPTEDGGPGTEGGTLPDGAPAPDCFDATKTKPVEPAQFLNQCNGGECFKFDNGTRVEGWKSGQPLPPLS